MKFRTICKVLSGLGAAVVMSGASAGVKVAAGDRHVQFTGRIDFENVAGPVISWPGTSIEMNFTGPTLAVTMDDQFGKNFFNVFVDGDLEHGKTLRLDQGSRTYVIASGLSAGKHSVLITKRTEGEDGATVVQGFELGDGGTLLEPPPRKTRRIEFFGDSITSGLGNEAPDGGVDNLLSEKNNFLSYAAITARQLDAEVHMISHSGIGIMISWFPYTMFDYYDQLNAVKDNQSKWDFGRWTPDVVVINLFQNDSWLIDREKRLVPTPDDARRIHEYKRFIQTIREHYPNAYIVCALGSMDAVRPGSKWPGYIRSAVEEIRKQSGDKRIDAIVFDYDGYEAHPRVRHHQANAAKLTNFIRQKMGW